MCVHLSYREEGVRPLFKWKQICTCALTPTQSNYPNSTLKLIIMKLCTKRITLASRIHLPDNCPEQALSHTIVLTSSNCDMSCVKLCLRTDLEAIQTSPPIDRTCLQNLGQHVLAHEHNNSPDADPSPLPLVQGCALWSISLIALHGGRIENRCILQGTAFMELVEWTIKYVALQSARPSSSRNIQR